MTALKVPANPVAERAVADVGADDDGFDDLTDEERAHLEAAFARGLEDLRMGRTIDGEEFFEQLLAEP